MALVVSAAATDGRQLCPSDLISVERRRLERRQSMQPPSLCPSGAVCSDVGIDRFAASDGSRHASMCYGWTNSETPSLVRDTLVHI